MKAVFLIILLFFKSSLAINIKDNNINSSLEIIPQNKVFQYGDYLYLGIKITLAEGWKTYWKNPGDAGASIDVSIESKDINKFEILFPLPKEYTDHSVKTIGYENEVIFPIKLKIDKKKKKISGIINIQYLICNDVCIPINEEKMIDVKWKGQEDFYKGNDILEYIDKTPKKNLFLFTIEDVFSKDVNTLNLVLENDGNRDIEIFPYSEETNLLLESSKINENIEFLFKSDEPLDELKKPIEFVVYDGFKSEVLILDSDDINFKKNIFKFLLFGFLGGIILNFMPCVLPILSLKVMSMIKLKENKFWETKKLSLFVVLGIVTSFSFLAIILIIFKTFGVYVGWGFHFQNFYFLIFISTLMLLFSLNLLGFFEIILPQRFTNYLATIEKKNTEKEYFFSGMFATLMATPCSAPFLGTAIGFSSLTTNFNILLIFLSISFGFALPYFFLIFKPKFIDLIPKPGKWMENLKIFLGVLLLATFSWLLNVIGINYVLNIIIFFTILLLSFLINKSINRLILVGIISLSIFATILLVPKDKGKIEWENFNETLLDEYLDKGDLIFLDFTADWCITCQVNKFTTLENKKVKRYFLENNVKLLRADWTNKDDKILEFIKKYERFGVPLNIIYSRKMTEGYILPEILSKTIVINNLDRIKDE